MKFDGMKYTQSEEYKKKYSDPDVCCDNCKHDLLRFTELSKCRDCYYRNFERREDCGENDC